MTNVSTDVEVFEIEKGNFKLTIGDESYLSERTANMLRYVLEKAFKKVSGKLFFSKTDDGVPIATFWLLTEAAEEFKFDVKDYERFSYTSSSEVTEKTQILGCDTASYLFNGVTINTMGDGQYGGVSEFRINRKKVATCINIDGGFMAETYDKFKEKVLYGCKVGGMKVNA